MKPSHLRVAGVVFMLALLWEAWQYGKVKISYGTLLGVLALIGYLLMEWLARAEEKRVLPPIAQPRGPPPMVKFR